MLLQLSAVDIERSILVNERYKGIYCQPFSGPPALQIEDSGHSAVTRRQTDFEAERMTAYHTCKQEPLW